jgi:hypothetical protein
VDTNSSIALLTTLIAGFVALIGYSLTQLTNRRERKSRFFAEALAAVREFQEIPYLIRRRQASDGATRAAIAQQISAVMAKLGFYSAWLQIDSFEVGAAYNDLVGQTRRLGVAHWRTAWREPLIETDGEMAGVRAEYAWDIRPELDLCLFAMRKELSFWSFAFRRAIRRSLSAQRQMRAKENATS